MKILNTVTKLSVLTGIVLLLLLFGYAIFGDRISIKTSPLVGGQAPEFSLELLNGGELEISDLKGKAVLLNFWASWCGPCRVEAPAIEAAWKKYRDKPVIFLGVNIWDNRDNALSYLSGFGGGYLHGVDPKGNIAVEYGISGVPETYFISPSGKITDKYTGTLTEEIIDYYMKRAISHVDVQEIDKNLATN